MFIRLNGRIGYFNADVTWFYKDNLDYLKGRIKLIYLREIGGPIPDEFNSINTITALKAFIKEHMSDMDNYPFGFKHIDGTYVLYECYG